MKKLLLVLIISLTTGLVVAKSTTVERDTQNILDNYLLKKSISGLEILKSEKGPSTKGLCDNPNSGCYTGFLGSCFYAGGTIVYCVRH